MPALYVLLMISNVLGMVLQSVKNYAPPEPDSSQSIYISKL